MLWLDSGIHNFALFELVAIIFPSMQISPGFSPVSRNGFDDSEQEGFSRDAYVGQLLKNKKCS